MPDPSSRTSERVTGRHSAGVGMLVAVHARPGTTRAEVAQALEIPSGFAAETAARLVASALVEERPGPQSGRRGRPSPSLWPHPAGPLVAVAVLAHETWEVAAVQMGGTEVALHHRPHGRDEKATLSAVGMQLRSLERRYGERIQAVVVAVPGTVTGECLVQAPNLGWTDVDLGRLRPTSTSTVFVAGNDATMAGVAEYRRGAAAGAQVAVHLYLDAGVGGVLIDGGRPVLGARGTAGEFGHMPFGPPGRVCRCGASGCWNTALDGDAIARLLGRPHPADQVTYSREVLAAAGAGDAAARRAVRTVARSLGVGAAALVNALDPEVVTVGGLGRDLLAVAGDDVDRTYRRGLMGFRAASPPPVRAASFGAEGPRIGAAEEGFARILTEEGLRRWRR